jgi:hemerythrin
MFEWNAKYATGICSIDAQHQTLFQLASKLHQAMSAGQGKAITGAILERLLQYTASHFAHEERLMRTNDYPDLPAHKAQHDALTKQVQDFHTKFQAGQITLTVELMHFLNQWLIDHIHGCDLKYVPLLSSKAVA